MFTELGLGALIAAATSVAACRLLMAAGLVDTPDLARKAHRTPTPTSGGLGVALGFALGLFIATMTSSPEWRAAIGAGGLLRAASATAFACAFLILGFLDDARPLGPRAKFVVFAALSVASVYSVGVVRALPLGGDLVLQLPVWAGLLGSALFVFTLVNCVNFMDGANGLAMGCVAIGLAALSAIAVQGGAPGAAAMAACGAAALAGFLVWNFPHGRLFAGDSGALFAGAMAALISLLTIFKADVSPFIPPIIFFPLLADVLLTLAWRMRQRRRVLEGHAEHLYQVAIRGGLGGRNVTLAYWVITAACGALAFFAAAADASNLRGGSYAPPLALALLAVSALCASALMRAFASRRRLGEV